jgi:hypothetical protein
VAAIALAASELIGMARIHLGAVTIDDWRGATDYVREQRRPMDLVLSAPDWTDPMLRWAAGDLISPAAAARSDLAPFERIWELSIRGARSPETTDLAPRLTHDVGPVTVRLFELGPTPVLYDFADHLPDARVEWVDGSRTVPCRFQRGLAHGGGLGRGPIVSGDRFVCDRASWRWVGVTIQEDLHYAPRRCIWQHPSGRDPVRVHFDDVPLGDVMVFYTGLYHRIERAPSGGPVKIVVRIDGTASGERVHRAGDGWGRFEVSSQAAAREKGHGTVTVEVSADQPQHRMFCWSGTVRTESRRRE